MEYIEREAFIADQRHLYCENCDRRKGVKNGKLKFVYDIGDAPCRACDIGDLLDSLEDYPAADVVPVVRCGEFHPKSVTNYDRIISKTPEELAEWIVWVECEAYRLDGTYGSDYWLKWLKKEISNGHLY